MAESNNSHSGDSAAFGGRCPWCSQPTNHDDLIADLRVQIAEDLEEWIRGAQTTGGEEGIWFARGLTFAAMWIRSANEV